MLIPLLYTDWTDIRQTLLRDGTVSTSGGKGPVDVDRVLERSQVVPAGVDQAFAFFADAWNLEAITPPWLRFRIVEAPPTLEAGSLLVYRLRLFGMPIRWRTEIVDWRPPWSFTDVQLEGPYRRWEHTHSLRVVRGGTEVHDRVVYRLPYEPFAGLVAPLTVRPWLAAIFEYRARQTEARLR
jgi:ligand-binding SRPBCC domain-containing protein